MVGGHILLFVMSGFVFGMEQDLVLCESVYKGIVPSLSINDYIVNAPNEYQALCKEASLEQDILQKRVKERDEKVKKITNKRNHILDRLSFRSSDKEYSLFHARDMDYTPSCCNVMIPFYVTIFGVTVITAGLLGVFLYS
jgi:hypothetical protein